MEYVALVAEIEEQEFQKIIEICESLRLELVVNHFDYDLEVAQGIRYFYHHVKANKLVQFILQPDSNTPKRHTTSDFFTQELSFHFTGKSDSVFLLLIKMLHESKIKYEKFFFVFANEWENKYEIDRVRLVQCQLTGIREYFNENNSWYLWLYSLEAKNYYPEFWCPLVFEINKND